MSNSWIPRLPAVGEVLAHPTLRLLMDRIGPATIATRARSILSDVQRELQDSWTERRVPDVSELAERVVRQVLAGAPQGPRPAINATGTLFRDDLGPVPLAEEAVLATAAAAADYAWQRAAAGPLGPGDPTAGAAALVAELTGAEAAAVTASHAGAVALALAALAADRPVVVSRSELVDFGEGVRLVDLAQTAGVTLREVGAANRTTLDDYAQAIGAAAGAILVVESGRATGGDAEGPVPLGDLCKLVRQAGVPLVVELGLGGFADPAECGYRPCATARQRVAEGADLVVVRGDRLVGGPACGLIVGRRASVERAAAHGLSRVVRADRLTAAALEATLLVWRDPVEARNRIPLWTLLGTSADNLKQRAQRLALRLAGCPGVASAEAVEAVAPLWGSTASGDAVPTWLVRLAARSASAADLARQLADGRPALVGRASAEAVELDLRCVFPRQDRELVSVVESVLGTGSEPLATGPESPDAETT